MRRGKTWLISVLLVVAVAAASFPPVLAGPKGKGGGGGGADVKVKVKISGEFADFPLPFAAVLVTRNRRKDGHVWTEYRVGLSLVSVTGFYKVNMPGHGWKLRVANGNSWIWTRGRRTVVVVFVRVTPFFSLIRVREYR